MTEPMVTPGLENRSLTIDNIESDLHHLTHLLDVAVGHMQGMDHTSSGPTGRNHEMDRADALVWIARDMSEKLAADISVFSGELARSNAEARRRAAVVSAPKSQNPRRHGEQQCL